MFATATSRLIVGLGRDKDGSLRVYVGARHTGVHTHVDDPTVRAEIERAWADTRSHVYTEIPASALCDCEDEVV